MQRVFVFAPELQHATNFICFSGLSFLAHVFFFPFIMCGVTRNKEFERPGIMTKKKIYLDIVDHSQDWLEPKCLNT